jgi:proline racemase
MQATLAALWQRRVAKLVVDDMYAAPRARCRACAALLQTPQGACPVCGSNSIDAVGDAVELAIEQTLDAEGALELGAQCYGAASADTDRTSGGSAALVKENGGARHRQV